MSVGCKNPCDDIERLQQRIAELEKTLGGYVIDNEALRADLAAERATNRRYLDQLREQRETIAELKGGGA